MSWKSVIFPRHAIDALTRNFNRSENGGFSPTAAIDPR